MIWISWGTGALASLLGLYISYVGNFPTGPLIVVMYALVLLGAGVLRSSAWATRRWFHETGGLAVGRFGGWNCRSDRPTTQPPSRPGLPPPLPRRPLQHRAGP